MPIVADLHVHSTASDGVDPPARVVERAHEVGIRWLALADHDTVAGVPEASRRAAELGITLIPCAEMTSYRSNRELHILAIGVDITDARLLEHCRTFHHERIARAREIGRRLEAAGAPIDMDRVMAMADGGSVGRVHVARALLEAGHIATIDEAFRRFIGEGGPANVPKPNVTTAQVIDLIRAAKGFPVLAHPGIGPMWDLVPSLIAEGLAGLEVYHSSHTWADEERALRLCYDHNLLRSGGSDCHGAVASRQALLGTTGLDEGRTETFLRMMAASTPRAT